MTKRRDRNLNTYDESNNPLGITLNNTTYTKLLDTNAERIGYKVSNTSPHDIIIFEGTPTDNFDRGFVLFKRSVFESPTDNVPIGEIFAKATTDAPTVLVTEE